VVVATNPDEGTSGTLAEEARRKAGEREAHILRDGPRLYPIELNELSSGLLAILARMESARDVLNSSAERDRGARTTLTPPAATIRLNI
jgi:hypothetical protein